MAVTKLNSNDIGVFVSTDGGTTKKEVVCGTDITIDGSVDVATTKTKCSTLKSVSEPSYKISFGGVANRTPGATTEVSAQELALLFDAGTSIWLEVKDRTTPANYFRQGTGYIASYKEDAPLDGAVAFDIEFEVDGALDFVS